MQLLAAGKTLELAWPEEQRPVVLLVDDEELILAALKRLLQRDGYRILTANSGAQALELLAENDVDVIVSDQRMPVMTGIEFLRRAKEMHRDSIRIVLSGYTELQTVTDAVNEGAIYKFLTKPWDDGQLREHIEEACRRKGLADDNRRLHHELQLANQRLQELLEETSHDGKPRLVPSPSRERLGQRWVGSEVTGLSSRPLKGGDGD